LYILKRKKLLEIPRINERDDIILKAHNFGHFRTESTYNRLKDNYFWYKMIEDKNMILYNECLMFKEILKLYSLLNDEYINHFTSNGDSITFYQPSYDGFLNTDGLITKTTKKRSTIIANENINYYTIDYLANKIKNFDAHHNPLILKNMDFLSLYQDTVKNEMLDEFLLTNNEDNTQA
ncbi:hypothetical protein BpHYR1_049822, partial [Brachionus plicatilis]